MHTLFGRNKREFKYAVPEFIQNLLESGRVEQIIQEKAQYRNQVWFDKLCIHRKYELNNMKKDFQSGAFLTAMKKFVYKLKDDVDISKTMTEQQQQRRF